MNTPFKKNEGADFIILPLVFVFVTALVVYLAFSPVVTPYIGLVEMFFTEKTAPVTTDRFTGLAEDLAQSGTLQIDDYPSVGEKIGQIDIDEIDMSVPVYYGDGNRELNKGAGLYAGAWLPGEDRTILMAGHVGTFFKPLEHIEVGMEIRFTTYYGEYVYKIVDAKPREATDPNAYDFSREDENLILYTCYPFGTLGYTPYRYFVYADYVSGPAVQWDGN